jgi:rare lipoprotein A
MKKIQVLLFIAVTSFSISVAQTEYGIASYYGTYFHGRPTASGEKYNQFALTAAHKTLKLGTIVKVTNPQNNKSVFVKINDRGPFIKGRVIDLSTKAAELLGYRNKGTAYVKIEIVKKEKVPEDLYKASVDIAKQNGIGENDSADATYTQNTSWKEIPTVNEESKTKEPANIPQPLIDLREANSNGITNRSTYFIINKIDENNIGFYGLQLGIFSDISVIFTLTEELEAKYKQSLIVQQVVAEGKTAYKLFIGKYQNRAYADALKLSLSDKYKDAFVVKYE